MADEEVVVHQETTRAERDAEGFANAIVLSSDDEDSAPRRPAVSSKRPAAASPCFNAAAAASTDVKPDIKRIKPGPAPSPQANPLPGNGNETELEDLAFAPPAKFAMGQARRAGHVTFKVSASSAVGVSNGAGDPTHVAIGTGREYNSHERLRALAYAYGVRVDDSARGELRGALERLTNPRSIQIPRHSITGPNGRHLRWEPAAWHSLIEVQWQPRLPWRLKRGQPAVEVRLDIWLKPQIFELRISTWHSAESCFYDIWMMMEQLTPMTPFVEPPRPPPVHGEAQLVPCGAAAKPGKPKPTAHSFTLAGLMRAMESAGYEEAEQPRGLELTLFPFQRQAGPALDSPALDRRPHSRPAPTGAPRSPALHAHLALHLALHLPLHLPLHLTLHLQPR